MAYELLGTIESQNLGEPAVAIGYGPRGIGLQDALIGILREPPAPGLQRETEQALYLFFVKDVAMAGADGPG